MKRFLIFVLALLIPIFCYAEKITIDDINLEIDVNDQYVIFTRENLDNNQGLEIINLSKQELLNLLEEKEIYLDIMDENITWEFYVVYSDTELNIHNLANLPDKMIRKTSDGLKEKYQAKDFSIYEANGLKYTVIDYKGEDNYNKIIYYTVVNSRGYNFFFQKSEEITSGDRKLLEDLISKVNVTVLEEYKEEDESIQLEIEEYLKPFNWQALIFDLTIMFAIITIVIVIIIVKRKKDKKKKVGA